jgi:hypothetical protein
MCCLLRQCNSDDDQARAVGRKVRRRDEGASPYIPLHSSSLMYCLLIIHDVASGGSEDVVLSVDSGSKRRCIHDEHS